jgi:RHS repeat-associated protein
MNNSHDGDGNRVMKSNGKIYWYGAGTEILEETDATGSMTNASFSEYIYFAGERVARHDASGNVFYYVQDALGTTDGMVEITANNATETFCYDADFYPYGGEKVYTNTCPQNYKFEGKERDAESGNDDFGARYYSSVYGRWLSPDWSSVPAPVPYANLNNPQTLNLYAMVSDNPETFADLDGHDCQDDGHGGTCQSHGEQDKTPTSTDYANAQGGSAPKGKPEIPEHQGHDSSGNPKDQNTGPNAQQNPQAPQTKDKTKPPDLAIGLGGVVLLSSEESWPGGPVVMVVVVGGSVIVYLAENSKHVKEVMNGLAAQIEKHMGKMGSTSNPDPQGGWKDEIRAALERMQRLSKRLGDKARQNYKDIMDQAAKALEQDIE